MVTVRKSVLDALSFVHPHENHLTTGDGSTPWTANDGCGANMNILANLFQSAEFLIGDTVVSSCQNFVPQVDTLVKRLRHDGSWLDGMGQTASQTSAYLEERVHAIASDGVQFKKHPDILTNNRQTALTGLVQTINIENIHVAEQTDRRCKIEVVWKLDCLSITGVNKFLGCGDYTLNITPLPSTTAQLAAYQTLASATASKVVGTGAANLSMNVKDIYYYTYEVKGDPQSSYQYFLKLNNTRCQMQTLTASTALTSNDFTVSRSTNALTLACQSTLVNSDSRASAAQFVSYLVAGSGALTGGEEKKLERFFIQYNGSAFPPEQGHNEDDATNRIDYTRHYYVQTQLANGKYFSDPEDLKTFHKRGQYIHQMVENDGKSTRCTVNTSFKTGTSTANMNVLLFDHYTTLVRVVVRNGRVVDVKVEDEK
jgi:hypothetical protein